MTKKSPKKSPKNSPKNSGFKSARDLFKNKVGSLNWENTEMRDRKADVRQKTIEDIQRLPHIKRIRTLTLCGENLVHEQMMLDTTDLYPHFEELVCLEGNARVHAAAKTRLAAFPEKWRKKITLLQAEDKRVLTASSGYQTEGESITSPRGRARISSGFDLIWLDWMNSFGKGIDQTISLLGANIGMFSRAWEKGNPGLLYLTLSCAKEEQADIKTLQLALSSFEPNYKEFGFAADSYRIRYYGLGALLNYHLRLRGAVATPTHGLFYREQKTHAMTMFFAGFAVYPTKEPMKGLPTFAEPQFSGVSDPMHH